MRDQILRFLKAIDEALAKEVSQGERLDLYVIGKAALVLFHDLGRGSAVTRDVDVVQISYPPVPLLARALELFGRDSQAPDTHGLYLEAVLSGLPPMPGAFQKRCQPFQEGDWRVLTIQQLAVHDLAVTKLNRFASKDRQDLRDLCDKGVLQAAQLRTALESAFLWTTEQDGDVARDRAFDHLRRVIAYLEGEARDL